jgi:hypothetical protein
MQVPLFKATLVAVAIFVSAIPGQARITRLVIEHTETLGQDGYQNSLAMPMGNSTRDSRTRRTARSEYSCLSWANSRYWPRLRQGAASTAAPLASAWRRVGPSFRPLMAK